MKKTIASLLIFVMLIILPGWLIFHYWFSDSAKQSQKEKPVIINAQTVKSVDFPIIIREVGSLIANQQADLSAREAGQIIGIYFKQGQFVKKDTLLVQLDNALEKASVDGAKAKMDLKEIDITRFTKLVKTDAASVEQLNKVQAEYAGLKATYDTASVRLEYKGLLAPFDGMLGVRLYSLGDYINVGKKVVTITDIKHLKVQYVISGTYLPFLKLGQNVSVRWAGYPDKVFNGKLIFISPMIDPITKGITLQARIPNNNLLLRPGIFVNVEHKTTYKPNTIVIPLKALMPKMLSFYVYKVVNGRAQLAEVNVGIRSNKAVEILSGLKAGDIVVTDGQKKLKNGQLVKIVPEIQ